MDVHRQARSHPHLHKIKSTILSHRRQIIVAVLSNRIVYPVPLRWEMINAYMVSSYAVLHVFHQAYKFYHSNLQSSAD